MVIIPLSAVKHLMMVVGWVGIWICISSLPGNDSLNGIKLLLAMIFPVGLFISGVVWIYHRSFDKNVGPFKYYSMALGMFGLILTIFSIANGGTMADSVLSAVLSVLYSLLFIILGVVWFISDKKPNGFSYKLNNYLHNSIRRK